eukprot:365702-Chlamydomonas_euryale.AAC.22
MFTSATAAYARDRGSRVVVVVGAACSSSRAGVIVVGRWPGHAVPPRGLKCAHSQGEATRQARKASREAPGRAHEQRGRGERARLVRQWWRAARRQQQQAARGPQARQVCTTGKAELAACRVVRAGDLSGLMGHWNLTHGVKRPI